MLRPMQHYVKVKCRCCVYLPVRRQGPTEMMYEATQMTGTHQTLSQLIRESRQLLAVWLVLFGIWFFVWNKESKVHQKLGTFCGRFIWKWYHILPSSGCSQEVCVCVCVGVCRLNLLYSGVSVFPRLLGPYLCYDSQNVSRILRSAAVPANSPMKRRAARPPAAKARWDIWPEMAKSLSTSPNSAHDILRLITWNQKN